ncbi:MAG: hypothetical protein K0Q57_987 [Gammaproteobacteria bacterium]|jgi:hypothetical protein|nr:hypothetical protein [Gammaproteobacteria bacterium]
MRKALLAACLIIAIPSFAANNTNTPTQSSDLCSQISGAWEGTYQDPSGLFISKAFPIRMALQYDNGFIYGYTMKSKDTKLGAGYGSQSWLVWGNCSNNTISNLYVINPNKQPVCGDPGQTPSPLNEANSMMLYIPWENAMTGTTFHASMKKVLNKFEVNQGLIDAARQMSKTQISTCH